MSNESENQEDIDLIKPISNNITNSSLDFHKNNTKPKISFKEQWNKVDKLCPSCGKVSEKAEGINRQNLKRLFSLKMNLNDIMIFLLIIMLLFSIYRYTNDTAACKTFLASGSQNAWNDMVKSGISIDSLIQAAKGKPQSGPISLTSGLANASMNGSMGGI